MNITEDQQEAMKAVAYVNEKFKAKYEKDECPILVITLANDHFVISLSPVAKIGAPFEIPLYTSWEDGEGKWDKGSRRYFEESDSYESFYGLLKRRWKQIREELNEIKWR